MQPISPNEPNCGEPTDPSGPRPSRRFRRHPDDPHEPLVGHEVAAEYMNVKPATLHQWNYRHIGPKSYKLGKHRLYRLSDLDSFIAARATPGGDAA